MTRTENEGEGGSTKKSLEAMDIRVTVEEWPHGGATARKRRETNKACRETEGYPTTKRSHHEVGDCTRNTPYALRIRITRRTAEGGTPRRP